MKKKSDQTAIFTGTPVVKNIGMTDATMHGVQMPESVKAWAIDALPPAARMASTNPAPPANPKKPKVIQAADRLLM